MSAIRLRLTVIDIEAPDAAAAAELLLQSIASLPGRPAVTPTGAAHLSAVAQPAPAEVLPQPAPADAAGQLASPTDHSSGAAADASSFSVGAGSAASDEAAKSEARRSDGEAKQQQGGGTGKKWSAQRLDVLRRDYPAGVSMGELLARLNALPGPAVTDNQGWAAAAKLGLKRPSGGNAVRSSNPAQPAPAPAILRPAAGPIVADAEQIRRWAAQRGLATAKLDIEAVNRKCREIGHPEFVLKPPPGRVRDMRAASA